MPEKQFLSVQLPVQMVKEIESYAEQAGISRSAAVRKAISDLVRTSGE